MTECAACGHEVTTNQAGQCINRSTLACPVTGWNPTFGNDFPCCTPCPTHQIRNCTICLPDPMRLQSDL